MTPVEGPMAEGIMSTVAMGPSGQAEGGPAPVNFSQGGAVQYLAPLNATRAAMLSEGGSAPVHFDEGGLVSPNLIEHYRNLYTMPGSEQRAAKRAAALEEERNYAQAGMLFDVASAAAQAAFTPVEKLGPVLGPPLERIGDRIESYGRRQTAYNQSLNEEKRKEHALAVTAALQAERENRKAIAEAASAKIGDLFRIYNAKGEQIGERYFSNKGDLAAFNKQNPGLSFKKAEKSSASDILNLRSPEGKIVALNIGTLKGQEEAARLMDAGWVKAKAANLEDAATKPSYTNFVNRETNQSIMVDLSTQEGRRMVEGLQLLGFLRAGEASLKSADVTPKIQVVINKNNNKDIRSFDLNDPEQVKQFNSLDSKTYIPIRMPSLDDLNAGVDLLGKGMQAQFIKLTSKPEVLEQYANGTLDAFSANTINAFVTQATVQRPVVNPNTGRLELVPGFRLSPALQNAIERRSQLEGITPAQLPLLGGKDVLNTKNAELDKDPNTTGRITLNHDGTVNFDVFREDPVYLITGVDLTKSQTWRSTFNRFKNFLAGQIKLGDGYGGEKGRITSQADKQLNSLAKKIVQIGRAGVDGKVFAYDIEMLKEEVNLFKPGGIKTDVEARDQLVAVRNSLASMYIQAYQTASDPAADRTGKTIVQANVIIKQLEDLLAETTAAVAIYDKYLGGDEMDKVISDRAATSAVPVTSRLPRASSAKGNQ